MTTLFALCVFNLILSLVLNVFNPVTVKVYQELLPPVFKGFIIPFIAFIHLGQYVLVVQAFGWETFYFLCVMLAITTQIISFFLYYKDWSSEQLANNIVDFFKK